MTITSYAKLLLLGSLTTACLATQDEYSSFTFGLAQEEDIPSLTQLTNDEMIHDSDRLVVLPEQFRKVGVEKNIQQKRLFIAKDGETIVGVKKLFVVTDENEKQEMLRDEIRCQGAETEHLYTGLYDTNLQLTETTLSPLDLEKATIIYNGADFTPLKYRQKGINRSLMKKALEIISPQVADQINDTQSETIAMTYGLTNVIAGVSETEENPGDTSDRTSSIVKSFHEFVGHFPSETESMQSSHLRYDRFKAFKPSFNPDDSECKPLDDQHAIEGRGCILSFHLNKPNNEQ